jgi:RNA polymerase sigma factor (sigma-70 family)
MTHEAEPGPRSSYRPRADHTDLVSRCRAGDPRAWDTFLHTFQNLLHTTLRKYDLDEDEREEAFQTTVMAAYEGLDRLADPRKLVPWLIGIASRQAVNRIRAGGRQRRALADEATRAEDRLSSTTVGDLPDAAVRRLEDAQLLSEALAGTTPRCRSLLTLLFLTEPRPSYQEIADRLEFPRGSIGPHRQRCLARLRRFLAERGALP